MARRRGGKGRSLGTSPRLRKILQEQHDEKLNTNIRDYKYDEPMSERAATARLDHNRSIVRFRLPPSEAEHYAAYEQPEYLASLARDVDARFIPV